MTEYEDLTNGEKALFEFMKEGDYPEIEPDDLTTERYDYYGSPVISAFKEEYAVIPDRDIESVFKEYAENLIDDVVLPEIPENYQSYFDYDKFIQDMSFDGYGQMSSYDGADNEQKIDNEYYHILRMN